MQTEISVSYPVTEIKTYIFYNNQFLNLLTLCKIIPFSEHFLRDTQTEKAKYEELSQWCYNECLSTG